MSTQREDLATLIAKHHDKFFGVEYAEPATQDYGLADALIADGWTKPRTITTVEELDALPIGSVVLDVEGDVCERAGGGWTGIIKERSMDSWLLTGAEAIDLPATVLYDGAP